ncbi:branched-chain amino acid transport system ATP-binding protein [Kribbella antiqua]|uniref:Branched-chain amino acid transport system ATP-binding protein n=1 Tax=Kribbella antiqua TaxID=2512217 RepID=A0A4R2IXT7_9ACTN|nr:ABC transporter ATP-binding protein [Kribbella antiqua]TCO50374.1 branched-chain amino acid transport system ATP-binding protein [Kribbella antiqua]
MSTLTVEGLSVRYGGVRAAQDVTFTVEPGQSLGIIGANGAGKTSTLKAIMGLAPRQARTIRFGDDDLLRAAPHTLVRRGIGYVPEGRHVFPGLPVEKNLLLGAYCRTWKKTPIDEVYDLFPVLGDMRHRLAGTLSGGQQQMLAVGRALMCRPKVMLLDEPSMGLSPILVAEIATVLKRLNADGLGIVLVEQNAKLTFEVTTTCLVMENGEIAATGTSHDLRHDPQVRRIYLGL